jgi:hypothetical protein
MSGLRGEARSGKVKLKARVTFHDTGRTVSTNIFVSVYVNALEVVELIEAKYGKPLTVASVKDAGKCGSIVFAEPMRLAA